MKGIQRDKSWKGKGKEEDFYILFDPESEPCEVKWF